LTRKVVVIGAGAAGLMAAGKAAERGLGVTLIEKNDRVGKKILISGKGRCNITNAADINEFVENIPGNGNFLYSAFYNFSNKDLISFFNKYGLKTKVERGGRVFPQTDRSKDVVDALVKYINKYNVKLLLNAPVHSIQADNGKVRSVILKDGRIIDCDSIILATGGLSYPNTGSTGDGYRMAKSLGHTIRELRPSLVPLVTEESWVKELQGLSLRNISISVLNNDGKKIYSDFGELLFTHFGVSGPVILSCSRHLIKYNYSGVRLIIDLKPALSERKLYERVHRDFDKFSRKQYKNSLNELFPQKLIPVIMKLSGISPDKFVNQISREERKNLVHLMKSLTLKITGSRPIEEAIITAGGVSTNEINPSTMESKIMRGLFFAGEIIDVDGYTGGYNLTIAFSTGYLAGASC
jgi:predicted Rossmann fold flavoprotein